MLVRPQPEDCPVLEKSAIAQMFQRRMSWKSGEYFHGIYRTAIGEVTELSKE